jgi:integrase/recombinase XerD
MRPEPQNPCVTRFFLSSSGLPLKPRAVQSIVKRLTIKTGISGVRGSPHTFRHTFARNYLMNGGDVFSLQRMLGHTSLEIVKHYINLTSNDIANQHLRFSPVDNIDNSNHKKRTIP